MSDVVVVGGGPIGLSAAMLLGREGHSVTVLEKDPQPVPTTAQSSWEDWERPGVAQFRQVHHMQPKFFQLLSSELPDVRARLESMGARRFNMAWALPATLEDRAPRPDDDRFDTLEARRAIIEAAFALTADDAKGVTVVRGVTVEGPVTGRPSGSNAPHVTGVRTSTGERIPADLVVDAMGRRSKFGEWTKGIGGRAPEEKTSDIGFSYYSRHYRSRGGEIPKHHGLIAELPSAFSILAIPADNDGWTVTLACMATERAFKAVRHNEVWERVVRSVPEVARWLDGEPLSDVLPMAGALDRYRRFVVDGEPVVTGMVAVGDAWACTNPTAGRGLSLGLGQAVALRDLSRTLMDDPTGFALAYDQVTETQFTPWFRQQMERDHGRMLAVQAATAGRQPPKPDPANPLAMMQAAFMTAAAYDPDVARAALEIFSVLALPPAVISRPGMIDKVMAAAEGRTPPKPPGPTYPELLKLLDA